MFRKLIVIVGIGLVLLVAGLPSIVAWLDRIGVIESAAWLRAEYLTGTAITTVVALLILPPRDGGAKSSPELTSAWYAASMFAPVGSTVQRVVAE